MQIVEYSPTEAALTTLSEQYSGVTYDVTTTAGMTEAKYARSIIKGYRTALEKKRVELKAPALERSRLIDAEAKRITAELVKLEDPIDEQIKVEETRKEQEKAAKAEADRQRIANTIGKIEQIKSVAANVTAMKSGEVANVIMRLEKLEVGDDEYQEFRPMAQDAKISALQQLSDILTDKLTQEADAERAEGERLAEEARLQAEHQERERLAKIESERLAAEQERLDAERAAFEAEKAEVARRQAEDDRIAREAREAEENRLAEERAATQAIVDAEAAENRRLHDEFLAKKAEEDHQAALLAEEERKRAEAKAKAAEKARKLAEARCDDAVSALKKILAICTDGSLQDYEALIQIALIAEGNI